MKQVKVHIKPKMSRADYAVFMNENDCTVNIRERDTDKEGIAVSCDHPDLICVFYGEDDGSEDNTITREDFNKRFIITSIEFHTWAIDYDNEVKPYKDFSQYVTLD
jgi:hypothetical protein